MSNIVNPTACNGETISIYQLGSFKYVYISSATGSSLYFQDGTFYCMDAPNYDCLSAYGLGNPVSRYTCSNFDTPEKKDRERGDRVRQFKPEGLTVYPNPTIGALTIQLPSIATDGYQLYLHDLLGRTVHQEATTPTATSVNIDMSEYENGVYYIELRASGWRGIQKVVKQGLK